MSDIETHIKNLRIELRAAVAAGDFILVVSIWNRIESAKMVLGMEGC